MPPISELLKSTTNKLVLINVAAFILLDMFYAGAPTGLELYFWKHPDFAWYQPLSSMFLHGSWSHLAFNMLALWSFGRVLEQIWGAERFLIFYLLCGMGAALIHVGVANFQIEAINQQILAAGFSAADIQSVVLQGRDISVGSDLITRETLSELYGLFNAPAVGASGAIYGILVAFAMLFPNYKVVLIFLPIPIAAKFFVPVLLLIDLTSGLTGVSIFGGNIAHFAHIGGAIVGFLLVQYWLTQRPYR